MLERRRSSSVDDVLPRAGWPARSRARRHRKEASSINPRARPGSLLRARPLLEWTWCVVRAPFVACTLLRLSPQVFVPPAPANRRRAERKLPIVVCPPRALRPGLYADVQSQGPASHVTYKGRAATARTPVQRSVHSATSSKHSQTDASSALPSTLPPPSPTRRSTTPRVACLLTLPFCNPPDLWPGCCQPIGPSVHSQARLLSFPVHTPLLCPPPTSTALSSSAPATCHSAPVPTLIFSPGTQNRLSFQLPTLDPLVLAIVLETVGDPSPFRTRSTTASSYALRALRKHALRLLAQRVKGTPPARSLALADVADAGASPPAPLSSCSLFTPKLALPSRASPTLHTPACVALRLPVVRLPLRKSSPSDSPLLPWTIARGCSVLPTGSEVTPDP